jgi:hypothetical protein
LTCFNRFRAALGTFPIISLRGRRVGITGRINASISTRSLGGTTEAGGGGEGMICDSASWLIDTGVATVVERDSREYDHADATPLSPLRATISCDQLAD